MVLVSFCSFIGKCLRDHFVKTALIDSDIFPTGTLDFVIFHLGIEHFSDSIFMAAEHFTLS